MNEKRNWIRLGVEKQTLQPLPFLSWDGDKVGSQQRANDSNWLEKRGGFISTKYNKYISEKYP